MKNRLYKRLKLSALIILILFVLVGCVPEDGSYSQNDPAGLFSGIWHGWIAPVSLVLSIFNKSISIYEAFNTGFWYDFGFYMAIISGFGGLSLARKKR